MTGVEAPRRDNKRPWRASPRTSAPARARKERRMAPFPLKHVTVAPWLTIQGTRIFSSAI